MNEQTQEHIPSYRSGLQRFIEKYGFDWKEKILKGGIENGDQKLYRCIQRDKRN